MPIDFLGKGAPSAKKTSADLKWHVPGKEEVGASKKIETKPLESEITLKKINLAESFKYYFLKRRLTFSLLFVIIVVAGVYGYLTYVYKPKPPVIVVNQPIVIENLNIVVPPPPPPPPPVITYQCADGIDNDSDGRCDLPTSICTDNSVPGDLGCLSLTDNDESAHPNPPLLADTELSPLRGSLVRFSGEADLFLVERNGELRFVDTTSVVFNNGQSVSQISSRLIYVIADRFKNIRRGKNVYGKVDWDPRILSLNDITPFLK